MQSVRQPEMATRPTIAPVQFSLPALTLHDVEMPSEMWAVTHTRLLQALQKLQSTSTGCVYIGNVNEHGHPSGWGVLTHGTDTVEGFFDGDVQNVKECVINTADVQLKGELCNGLLCGECCVTTSDGCHVNGHFSQGKMDGMVTIETPIMTYTGDAQSGFANGRGTMVTRNDRLRYDGHWLRGVPHDMGTEVIKSSQGTDEIYEGRFNMGQRHGMGTLNFEERVEYSAGSVVTRSSLKEKMLAEHLEQTCAFLDATQKQLEDVRLKKEELESTNAPSKCCICIDRDVTSALVPCGHMCMCQTCEAEYIRSATSGGIIRCPVCRSNIESIVTVRR